MNAPFLDRGIQDQMGGLHVFAFFHLNSPFPHRGGRAEVIARLLLPLLRLAENIPPIGIEVSGYTLERLPSTIQPGSCRRAD